jgi:hypothetical protein
VLDVLTHVYAFLDNENRNRVRGYHDFSRIDRRDCEEWVKFLRTILREEALGYRLDERCGVHYHIDEDVEQVRAASIAHLGSPRYKAALQEFETAYRNIEAKSR